MEYLINGGFRVARRLIYESLRPLRKGPRGLAPWSSARQPSGVQG